MQTADDWHEHDGYVTKGTPATWGDLESALADDESFTRWSPDDEHVRRAWLATDGSFYLRWFTYDDSLSPSLTDEPPVGGDADLTADARVISSAREALAALKVPTEVLPAREFFQAGWAG